jgi:hypothetical protein
MSSEALQGNSPSQSGLKMPPASSLHGRIWKPFIIGLAIFFAGGVTGLAVARSIALKRMTSIYSETPEDVANRLQNQLGLSDTQRDDLETIVRKHVPELRAMRAKITKDIRESFTELIDDMSTVLTSEQKARWRPRAEERLNSILPLHADTDDSVSTP